MDPTRNEQSPARPVRVRVLVLGLLALGLALGSFNVAMAILRQRMPDSWLPILLSWIPLVLAIAAWGLLIRAHRRKQANREGVA
ncbi:MAG: hypothetical protein ABIP29_02150 [Candidatus Eisenbacteria bacterium]